MWRGRDVHSMTEVQGGLKVFWMCCHAASLSYRRFEGTLCIHLQSKIIPRSSGTTWTVRDKRSMLPPEIGNHLPVNKVSYPEDFNNYKHGCKNFYLARKKKKREVILVLQKHDKKNSTDSSTATAYNWFISAIGWIQSVTWNNIFDTKTNLRISLYQSLNHTSYQASFYGPCELEAEVGPITLHL